MESIRKTFRLFVSSTFSDLKAERNALQERVFPRIRTLCEQHGAHFQAIDLRWGVSTEASLDQQTMNICLGEISRCQEITPRPNFLILLGDRYGWRPPPPQIPGEEFEAILEKSDGEERELLKNWYSRDDNAIPPEYVLQPRVLGGPYEQPEVWELEETRLHDILERAAEILEFDESGHLKYWASATHQEIAAGAMRVEDAEKHVLCFIREIEGLPQDHTAAGFLDLDEEGNPDQDAAARLDYLKEQLSSQLTENVVTYQAGWEKGAVSQDHLDRFCDKVYACLSDLILVEAERAEAWDFLEREITAHRNFGAERTRTFIGREEVLAGIEAYINAESRSPLAVGGASGSGKSALLARAAEQVESQSPGTEVVVRFIGSTPASSNGRELLGILCMQIGQMYGLEDSPIPSSYRELELDFRARLTCASKERPLVLFLDALDQLSPGDRARRLTWLPVELPEHVSIIISTIPGEVEIALQNKLPEDAHLPLEAMPAHEAEELLDLWLSDASRTLQTAQREEILSSFKNCPQPLFLKLAFDEARRWTSYAGVPDGAEGQSGFSNDIKGVLRAFIARLSSEAQHGEPLVTRSLGYIASGKHGLTEDELLDVLSRDVEVLVWFLGGLHHIPIGLIRQVRIEIEKAPADFGWENTEQPVTDETVEIWLTQLRDDENALRGFLTRLLNKKSGIKLPVVLWSRLYFDLEPYLTKRSSDGTFVLDFYHRQVGDVVNEEFRGGELGMSFHQTLAMYFSELDLHLEKEGAGSNLRMMVELPYQQAHAHLWDELKMTLTDYAFLHAKTNEIGSQQLIDDFDEALRVGYKGKEFSTLQGAIRLSANVLHDDPSQLPGVFLGRLMENPDPEIRSFLKQVKKWEGGCWLRPRTPNLAAPGGALLRTLEGHAGSVTAVDTFPGGSGKVISAGEDQTLRIWDGENGDLLSFFKGATTILSVDLLPDERHMISGGIDGVLCIWDLDTGKSVQRLTGHSGTVHDVEICPGGNRALSASEDHTLILWDIASGQALHKLEGHTGAVNAVAVSPTGRLVLSASDDRTLRLWDIESGDVLHTLRGHSAPVTAAVFLEEERQALSGAFNARQFSRCLKVWDLERGEEVRTIRDRTWGVHALLALPEEGQAAAAITDGTIKIVNFEKGYIQRTLEGHVAEVLDLALSKKGGQLISASADGTLRVWDYQASTSRYNDLFDTSLPIDHRHLLQERVMSEPSQTGYHALSVDAVSVFPNRSRAVTITNIQISGGAPGGLCQLAEWDLKSGMRIRTQELSGGEITAAAVSPDGECVLLASDKHKLRMVDLQTGHIRGLFQGHTDLIAALAIAPHGSLVASASNDRTIRLWDLETLNELYSLIGHGDAVTALAFSPDGKQLITGSADHTLRHWDLESRQMLRTLTGHQGTVNGLAVLPDGERVISGSDDHNLKLWDVQGGEVLVTLEDHEGPVVSVGVLAGGQYAASASLDGSIKIWDLGTGKVMAVFTGEGAFRCLAAKTDEQTIIAGDELGRTHILQLVDKRAAEFKNPRQV